MSSYNVHIYREMRLVFGNINAETPQAAALIARDIPTSEADEIDDCEGESFAALVDEIGDEAEERSVTIEFEGESERRMFRGMLATLKSFVEADDLAEECHEWKWENLAHAFRLARSIISEAETSLLAPVVQELTGKALA
jgi:hypothetical protein